MKIKCPKCSQHYEIADELFDKPMKCQVCDTAFKANILVEPLTIKKNIRKHKVNPNDLTGTVRVSRDNIWKNWE